MKVYFLFSLFLLLFISINAEPVKYKRGSLYTLMVSNSDHYAKTVSTTFLEIPMQEKFNNHNLKQRILNLSTGDTGKRTAINKYMIDYGIAREMIARWFNRDEKGCFNMELVAERGQYNASEIDAGIARKTKRGLTLLSDAGEELISNTFVLVSDFKFISKEELMKMLKEGLEAGKSIKNKYRIPISAKIERTVNASGNAAEILSKGYVVITTSYLYRLNWNDSIATVFYKNLWMDKSSVSEKKKRNFDTTTLFTLSYVGSDIAWADVQSTIFTKSTEEDMIKVATVRAQDAVIAKLQRKYEAFKTSTPLAGTDPIAARIGLKEGLRPKDKYNVLEQIVNNEGRTVYKKVGLVKVKKSGIWDNRYMATGDSLKTTNASVFKKVKGGMFYEGMLIKQKGKRNFLIFKI